MLPKRALSLTGLLLAPMVSWGFSYETPSITPEVGSGFEEKPGWAADSFAVAAANPLATDAGYQVLKAGGNAIDAAVAVQMVLTLVEPQSSGIGGGAFLMHFDGADVQAYDGRETAPAAVTGELFMEDGEPLPFMEAVASGLSVGVPGTLRMLEQAHAEHGQLAWQELFTPAITLAEEGFAVSQRLHTSLANDEYLRENDLAQAFYYSADGEPLEVGTTLKNPALAAILRRIAEEGSAAFYEGEVAEDLVEQVQSHPVRPGKISLDDISGYQSLEREPLCTPWQQWEVCGFPPPSSGHLTIMQILGMLDQQPLLEAPLENGVTSSGWLHQFLEASRLAFADRGRYIADPDFVEAPGGDWSLMLAPDYLGKRSELIGEESMGESAEPGNPDPKEQRNTQAELLALVGMLLTHPEVFRHADVVVFDDSTAAKGNVEKGSAADTDSQALVALFWRLTSALDTRVHVFWLPSVSNPGDAFSRPLEYKKVQEALQLQRSEEVLSRFAI